MMKKVLAAVLAATVILPCGASAEYTDKFDGHWELNTTRYWFCQYQLAHFPQGFYPYAAEADAS